MFSLNTYARADAAYNNSIWLLNFSIIKQTSVRSSHFDYASVDRSAIEVDMKI